jgi:hypothetical protein
MTLQAETGTRGVAVVMPAFREEGNLEATVEDMLGTLADMDDRHYVVIVNDGSDDRTGEIADALAVRYPGQVKVVHHEVNKGYGTAVRTGITAALERTDAPLLLLTDSDGQFRAGQIPWFVDEAVAERADAVIGFRPRRADPAMRKVNAWLWTRACRLLLGVGARDVDCAYKLIDRRVLDGIELHGDAATISPELLMNLRARGARILQRPVEHYPRMHGEQTGAKLSVILLSLLGLAGLWTKRMRRAWPGRALDRVVHPSDPLGSVITVTAVVAAVVSYLVFAARHDIIADPRSVAHLVMARRLLDAPGAGLNQLGGVYLPLPQLLAVPTIWITAWYHSGLSGSVVSMVAYVMATRYLYQTGRGVTGSARAGAAAAVVFAAAPDVLYLQSVPMPPMLVAACASASAWHLTRWTQTGASRQLAGSATAMLLATLTSFDGWVLDGATLLVVAYVSWRQPAGRPSAGRPSAADRLRATEAHLLFFALPLITAIAGWFLWSARFPVHGKMRLPAHWYPPEFAGTGPAAALAFVGLIGGGYYLIRNRLRPAMVAPLGLAVFLSYDSGMLVLLPAALFSGYFADSLASELWPRAVQLTACALVAAAVVAGGWETGVWTLRQATQVTAAQRGEAEAADWLRVHADAGQVVMQLYGNETVAFALPASRVVTENSPGTWPAALREPAARWIYMRQGDLVWNALHGSQALSGYVLADAGPGFRVYERRQS